MKAVFISCEQRSQKLFAGSRIASENPDAVFIQGDTPYVNDATNAWGTAVPACDKDSVAGDFLAHHSNMHENPGWIALMAGTGQKYYMPDDHEWAGDDWDHTIDNSPSGTTLWSEVVNHWNQGNIAVAFALALFYDNPENTDAEAVAELPTEIAANAPATPTTNYPVRYFRVTYDINGNVTTDDAEAHSVYYMLDCISYRSAQAATDNSSKTMLGANQKAWLKARMVEDEAAGIALKAIVVGKKTYKDGGNGDTFGNYTTERDELIAWIDANATGVVWLAGDQHRAHVIASLTSEGDTYDHTCIVGCPVGTVLNNANADAGTSFIRWVDTGADGAYNSCYGVAEALSDRWKLQIKGVSGRVKWEGQVLAGSNALTYADNPVSI